MAESQTVIQLRDKQAELQDAVSYLEGKLTEARADLIHVNAVLRLFELGPDAREQFPAHINLSRMFAKGELVALSQCALRGADGPMTTRDIAAFVIAEKGWDQKDPILRKGVAHRLVHTLSKAMRRGAVASPGYQKGVRLWTTA